MTKIGEMKFTPYAKAKLDIMNAIQEIIGRDSLQTEVVIHILLTLATDRTFDLALESAPELFKVTEEN